LKEKIEAYVPEWDKFSNKEQRKFKEIFKQDRITILKKIELITGAEDRKKNYLEDITELLGRLKKIGFEFIKEEPKEPERVSPVL